MSKPYCYAATRDGYLVATLSGATTSEAVGSFASFHLSNGCTIEPFANRTAYLIAIDTLRPIADALKHIRETRG